MTWLSRRRNLRHLLALAGELQARGVDLQVAEQGIDTSAPTGRLVFRILGAIESCPSRTFL